MQKWNSWRGTPHQTPSPEELLLNRRRHAWIILNTWLCCLCAHVNVLSNPDMTQHETSMQCATYQDCSYFLKTQAFCPSHWNCAIDWQRSIWHFFQLSNACQDVALSSKTLLDAAWIDAWSSARLNKRHPILAARRPEAWRTMAQSHLVWQLGLGAYDLQSRCR